MSEKMVRVIRDSLDSSKDYELPESEAKKLFDEGKLQWSDDNNCYIEPGIPWTMT
jgi:hypothetical protein